MRAGEMIQRFFAEHDPVFELVGFGGRVVCVLAPDAVHLPAEWCERTKLGFVRQGFVPKGTAPAGIAMSEVEGAWRRSQHDQPARNQ